MADGTRLQSSVSELANLLEKMRQTYGQFFEEQARVATEMTKLGECMEKALADLTSQIMADGTRLQSSLSELANLLGKMRQTYGQLFEEQARVATEMTKLGEYLGKALADLTSQIPQLSGNPPLTPSANGVSEKQHESPSTPSVHQLMPHNSHSQPLRDMEIEREQSSTYQAEREKKKIVMLALGKEECRPQFYHILAEFHSVDLEHNILTRSCFPTLIMGDFLSSAMVSSLNKVIYLVGGDDTPGVPSSYDSSSSNHTLYSGGSCLDMSNEAPLWRPAPVFVEDNTSPNYVSFLGNIYNFGSVCLAPQVLDCDALGHCKSIRSLRIPQSLAGCSVSVPVLPDPSNKRILMRLCGGPLSSPSLYAFTPDPNPDAIGTWECLTSDFPLWARTAAVVNGVIYFHRYKFPSLLHAFHITKKIWLKVWWDSCFKDNVDMNVKTFDFDAMLHLGRNILCFAGWTNIYPKPAVFTIKVILYKFQVLVSGKAVTVKACDSYSYELPESYDVLHFLPV